MRTPDDTVTNGADPVDPAALVLKLHRTGRNPIPTWRTLIELLDRERAVDLVTQQAAREGVGADELLLRLIAADDLRMGELPTRVAVMTVPELRAARQQLAGLTAIRDGLQSAGYQVPERLAHDVDLLGCTVAFVPTRCLFCRSAAHVPIRLLDPAQTEPHAVVCAPCDSRLPQERT